MNPSGFNPLIAETRCSGGVVFQLLHPLPPTPQKKHRKQVKLVRNFPLEKIAPNEHARKVGIRKDLGRMMF